MSILKANRIENLTTTDGGININNSGNVGVGTDSPSFNLEVKDASGDCVVALNSPNSSNTEILFGDPDSSYSGRVRYGNSTNHLQFNTNASERLRIDSSGNVGIGTSSPGSFNSDGRNLVVGTGSGGQGMSIYSGNSSYGTIYFADGTSGDALYQGAVLYNHASNFMRLDTAGAERMRIDSSGNVGIGKSSNLFYRLTLAESSGDTGRIGWVSTSGNRKSSIDCANTAAIRFNIGTSDTERMRVTDNGLTFNGDTAAANALDDYEEGTFAPTVTGNTTAGTATYAAQRGKYTKIGDRVFFEIYVAWGSGTGSGSQLYVSGLPFTVQTSNATYPAVTIGYWDSVTHGASSSPAALLASGNNYVYFYSIPNGGGGNSAIGYDASGSIILSGHYKVN